MALSLVVTLLICMSSCGGEENSERVGYAQFRPRRWYTWTASNASCLSEIFPRHRSLGRVARCSKPTSIDSDSLVWVTLFQSRESEASDENINFLACRYKRRNWCGYSPSVSVFIRNMLSESESNATVSDCSICLSALKTGKPLLTLPCSHQFHLHCLVSCV